ncbi:MAG: hypothetical protein ACR652_12470 [Methylocystis sp.]|uniref:hypothetical protein n=1 Tax=Methylocystis sp. TaxID=1911079 RepID=UPI003DA46439
MAFIHMIPSRHDVACPTRKPMRVHFVPASVVAILTCVAVLFVTGQPVLATWAALALFGWLLIMGAAKANDTSGERRS